MKWIEWLIVLILVVIGLSCLTMSATFMIQPESISTYLTMLLQICIWIVIPVAIVAAIYLILKKKGKF